jgi:hypothetical protein
MDIKIRRSFVIVEERREAAGRVANQPLRRVAAVAVVENPFAGRYVDDLGPMIEGSAQLGRDIVQLALSAFSQIPVQSYGKGGIVGLAGEQEHANALLTTTFANPISAAIWWRRRVDLVLHQDRRAGHTDRHSDEPQGRYLRPIALRWHVARAA